MLEVLVWALEQAGFQVIYANDYAKQCKLTYESYFGKNSLTLKDVRHIDASSIPDSDIIVAGFPCQPFSKIGKLHGFADQRAALFWDLLRILKSKNPRAFVLENVKNLLTHDKGYTFELIRDALENRLGYDVHYEILNSKDFGLAQDRKRIYIVGFRVLTDFQFPTPRPRIPQIMEFLEKEDVRNDHYLSETYLQCLKNHKERHKAKKHGFGFKVLEDQSIASALVVGNMGRERNLIKGLPKPAGSINSRGDPINSENIRRLTPREYARLQGFPDTFSLPEQVTVAYRQIGNAVSPPVAKAVAERIRVAMTQAGTESIQKEYLTSH